MNMDCCPAPAIRAGSYVTEEEKDGESGLDWAVRVCETVSLVPTHIVIVNVTVT